MTIEDDVKRILRENKRFTGDGLPNAPTGAPLPVGDPESGVWNPKKVHLREMLLPIAQGIDEINTAVPLVNAARDAALAALDAEEASALAAVGSLVDEAEEIRLQIETNLFVYVTDDQASVTVQVGQPLIVSETTDPYPSVTLELVAA